MNRSLDASFTQDPIYIEAVERGVAYHRSTPESEVRVLGAKYRDDHWGPIAHRFMSQKWAAFFEPTEKNPSDETETA